MYERPLARSEIVFYAMRGTELDPVLGCQIWQGSTNSDGYPTMRVGGKVVLVARHFYTEAHGEIPAGCDLRSTCLVKRCVLPDHREPIDANLRRRLPRRRRS